MGSVDPRAWRFRYGLRPPLPVQSTPGKECSLMRLSPSRCLVATACCCMALSVIGCRRTPEPTPGTAEPVVSGSETPRAAADQEQVQQLPLPQENRELGVRIESTPPGIVVSDNNNEWLVLETKTSPPVKLVITVDSTHSEKELGAAVVEFEAVIQRYSNGKLISHGQFDDPGLGAVHWTAGTYSEDGEALEQLRAFTVHPAGRGQLVIYSVYPQGSGVLTERLAQLQAVIAGITRSSHPVS